MPRVNLGTNGTSSPSCFEPQCARERRGIGRLRRGGCPRGISQHRFAAERTIAGDGVGGLECGPTRRNVERRVGRPREARRLRGDQLQRLAPRRERDAASALLTPPDTTIGPENRPWPPEKAHNELENRPKRRQSMGGFNDSRWRRSPRLGMRGIKGGDVAVASCVVVEVRWTNEDTMIYARESSEEGAHRGVKFHSTGTLSRMVDEFPPKRVGACTIVWCHRRVHELLKHAGKPRPHCSIH